MNYIVIEGNIGAGKTTLATMLAKDWNARLVLEQFSDNPFLPGFYDNPGKYAFPLELSFLAERYQQLKQVFAAPDLFQPIVVADYCIQKSRIFATNNLPELEFALFGKLFEIIDDALPAPDILVYLYTDIDQLQLNIRKRGRKYEQNITDKYLEEIQDKYLSHLRSVRNMPVLCIDLRGKDFVRDQKIYELITDLLQSQHNPGFQTVDLS